MLPLRVPLLAQGDASLVDDLFIRQEAVRAQRHSMLALGLGPDSAIPMMAAAAAAAGTALARGSDYTVASDAVEAQVKSERSADHTEATFLDKMHIRMIKAACDKDREARALQLASRLHTDKSFQIAATVARTSNKPGVASRLEQLSAAGQPSSAELESLLLPAAAPVGRGASNYSGGPSGDGDVVVMESSKSKARPMGGSASAGKPSAIASRFMHMPSKAGGDDDNGGAGSDDDAPNPFAAAKGMESPSRALKRKRDGLEALAAASPAGHMQPPPRKKTTFAV
jgi:hypothetical protein